MLIVEPNQDEKCIAMINMNGARWKLIMYVRDIKQYLENLLEQEGIHVI